MCNLAILLVKKYLFKKALDKSSQVMKVFGTGEFNHTLALSLKENGKNLSFIALSLTLFRLIVSHISENLAMLALGSSIELSTNLFCWINMGLISKLFALIGNLAILVCDLNALGNAKFLKTC